MFCRTASAVPWYEASDWYQGTADAVRQNIRYIHEDPCRDVLVLSGDQLYRMDFRHLLQSHRDAEADITIAVLPVGQEQTAGFGIVRVNDDGRVVGFVEKPQSPDLLKSVTTPLDWIERRGVHAQGRPFLASMGIYL